MSDDEQPKDPLSFDFGLGFKSAGDRVEGERAKREQLASRLLPFHVGFLDDYFRGILPHDLIELGAETGVGKTDAITTIARRNAVEGRRVYVIALEAEEDEIERRTKYGLIAEWAFERKIPFRENLNYVDWYLGRCEGFLGKLDAEADEYMRRNLRGLHTFYKGARFGAADVRRLFLAIQSQADLIILDHLHYIDLDDDNENRGQREAVKVIRDVALGCGRPVILVVHLKKAEVGRGAVLVPGLDRIHGSSDIPKVGTSAIMISRAPFAGDEWWKRPTFFSVPKWRTGGASSLVALCTYDVRSRTYAESYTLGRLEDAGAVWTEIPIAQRPPWAKDRFKHQGGLTSARARAARPATGAPAVDPQASLPLGGST